MIQVTIPLHSSLSRYSRKILFLSLTKRSLTRLSQSCLDNVSVIRSQHRVCRYSVTFCSVKFHRAFSRPFLWRSIWPSHRSFGGRVPYSYGTGTITQNIERILHFWKFITDSSPRRSLNLCPRPYYRVNIFTRIFAREITLFCIEF